MIRSPTDGGRRLEAPPWEPLGWFSEGHGGNPDLSPGRALAGRSSSYGTASSRAVAVRSGLTRRGVIYEYIRAHPGTHVRGMAKELGLATGDLHYHLFWLEKNGFVRTRKSGFYRFVFPTLVFREEQEILLGVLSQETPREILLCLLARPMTQGELARSLGHSQPTVSWHMDRLAQLGVVSKTRNSGGALYEVAADRGEVLSFVRSYHPEAWKRWARRLGALVAGAGVEFGDKGGSPQEARPMPPAMVELIGKR
jgi:DNA-binding MarR family transcriptional regulator